LGHIIADSLTIGWRCTIKCHFSKLEWKTQQGANISRKCNLHHLRR